MQLVSFQYQIYVLLCRQIENGLDWDISMGGYFLPIKNDIFGELRPIFFTPEALVKSW